MQASHYTITAHRLVVLAEVNTVSQDWGYFLFKLSLAEALEEVTTRVAEEAWLYYVAALISAPQAGHLSVMFIRLLVRHYASYSVISASLE